MHCARGAPRGNGGWARDEPVAGVMSHFATVFGSRVLCEGLGDSRRERGKIGLGFDNDGAGKWDMCMFAFVRWQRHF